MVLLKLISPDYDTASKLFVLFLAYQLAASAPDWLLRQLSARKYKHGIHVALDKKFNIKRLQCKRGFHDI